jgi:hypothetical protein
MRSAGSTIAARHGAMSSIGAGTKKTRFGGNAGLLPETSDKSPRHTPVRKDRDSRPLSANPQGVIPLAKHE